MTTTTLQRALMAGILLVGLAAPLAAATEGDSGWQLRFHLAAIDFDSAGNDRGPGGRGYDIDIGAGLGVNGEYRFSKHLGLDVGLLAGGGVDVASRTVRSGETTWEVHDTLSFTALTVGPDIHLTPEARVDLYACPMVALMQYGGLVVESGPRGVTTRVDFDSDLAYGATLGLGVPFGRRKWSFNASLTYLDGRLDGSEADGLRLEESYEATMFGFGFGYRF